MISYKASFSKLQNGNFGARVICDPDDVEDFEAGTRIKITQKNGETKKREIEAVIWTGDCDREGEEGKKVLIVALVPDGGPAGNKGGSRKASSPKNDDDLPY
jgi:hypothetical protein